MDLIAINDNSIGVATDFGASVVFVGANEDRAVVNGTDRDDFIIFSEMNDLLLVNGAGGYDTVVYAGAGAISDFAFSKLAADGLLEIRNSLTDESIFVANDVEAFSLGGQTYDLASLWG